MLEWPPPSGFGSVAAPPEAPPITLSSLALGGRTRSPCASRRAISCASQELRSPTSARTRSGRPEDEREPCSRRTGQAICVSNFTSSGSDVRDRQHAPGGANASGAHAARCSGGDPDPLEAPRRARGRALRRAAGRGLRQGVPPRLRRLSRPRRRALRRGVQLAPRGEQTATPAARLALPALNVRAALLGTACAIALAAGVLAWRYAGGSEGHAPSITSSPSTVRAKASAPPVQPTRERGALRTRLVLAAARGDCWLSVRKGSRDGRLLYEGMLVEGESLRFVGKRLWVRMGAPWNLRVRLNGRAVTGLPADTGNVVITRDGLRLA
jgi:hypothetical protein